MVYVIFKVEIVFLIFWYFKFAISFDHEKQSTKMLLNGPPIYQKYKTLANFMESSKLIEITAQAKT